MKLTTRGRYAVTAMLDLSCYSLGEPVSPERLVELVKETLTQKVTSA
jgi:DNA-binding IscR family transcriptional regulator